MIVVVKYLYEITCVDYVELQEMIQQNDERTITLQDNLSH